MSRYVSGTILMTGVGLMFLDAVLTEFNSGSWYLLGTGFFLGLLGTILDYWAK